MPVEGAWKGELATSICDVLCGPLGERSESLQVLQGVTFMAKLGLVGRDFDPPRNFPDAGLPPDEFLGFEGVH
jgi:hypothetical protein